MVPYRLDGMFMLTLASHSGMEEHLLAQVLTMYNVPTASVLEGKHQHPTAVLPPSQKYSVFSPASW